MPSNDVFGDTELDVMAARASALKGCSQDAAALVDALPGSGGTLSNARLKEALGWMDDEDRYRAARDEAEDAGLIRRGRGRGGTVFLSGDFVIGRQDAADSLVESAEVEAAEPGDRYTESGLYAPMCKAIEHGWARDERLDLIGVSTTAYGGRRKDGKWSRPDITAIGFRDLRFHPQRVLDVTTFEVKKRGDLDITAVYEALSHRRASHRAIVVCHHPDDADEWERQQFEDVAPVALEHGIGLIAAAEQDSFDTWDVRVAPVRVEVDPVDVDDFIRRMVSELHDPLVAALGHT